MVHGPDDSACRVEDDVEIDHPDGDTLMDDSQEYEDVGDQDGREQFEEVFDPKVNDPEAPEVRGRKMAAGRGQQAHSVKSRDG